MVLLLFKDNMSTVQPVRSNGVVRAFEETDKPGSDAFARPAPYSETGLDGPDQIVSAPDSVTTKADGRVKIRFSKDDVTSEVLSIPGLLTRAATTYPNRTALVARVDENGNRKTFTFKEYETQVRTVAKAFLKLGLERYHSVCILGFNSPEWFISDLAAIYAGGFAAGIYTTNSPEACQYCAETSRANIIVVEDSKQLEKILQVRDKLTDLKAIVQYSGVPQEKGILSWQALLDIGEKESDAKLNAVLKKIAINECCTLVYTSGTVGNPKAVMLSHDNLLYATRALLNTVDFNSDIEVIVSYLPLSHIAAQIIEILCPIAVAGIVYFADKDALKGTLLNTLTEARPTVFLGVPRVWEKIHEKMIAVGRSNGTIKTWIASWAKAQGLNYNTNKMNGVDYKHWGYVIAKWLVFNKVKAALGLDRCHYFCSAAAPLSVDVKKYFMSLDILIMDVYGMSECAGPHTLGLNDSFRLGSIGRTLNNFRTKLDNPDSEGSGEICMFGRHVFMGYLNAPEKTVEAIDQEGWLHSGDLGKLDDDGFLYITGRIKELIITAGGENIPPVRIEELVLAELPALSNVLLVGDRRKYLTILVSFKTDMNIETGEPLDTLNLEALKWAKSIGSKVKTVTEILNTKDSVIYREIEEAIKRANTKAISNAQKVQKFRILPHDFSVPTGELGPTLKLKRNVVYNKYADLIEEMYTDK